MGCLSRPWFFNLGLEKSQFIITMGMGFEQILSNDKHSQIAKLAKITSFAIWNDNYPNSTKKIDYYEPKLIFFTGFGRY
jgi:hypothetical protein